MAREDEFNELFDRLRKTATEQLTKARIDPGGDKSVEVRKALILSLDEWFKKLSDADGLICEDKYIILRDDITGF